MEWTLEAVIGWFERVYLRTLAVAQAVPTEWLDWRPRQGEFSCADLIRHIASAEVMNVRRLDKGQLLYPGHTEDFGRTKAEVIAYLETCHAQARRMLARYEETALTRLVPTSEGQIEGWRVLVGLIEHEIHHRSQLCSYLSQIGLTPPALYGLYVEDLPV